MALVGIALPGCLAPGMGSHSAQPVSKVTMRDTQTGEVVEELTRLQLQSRLFDLCDLWASMIKSSFDPLIDQATDMDVRSSLVEQKLRAIVSGYSIGASADPVGGMLDMMVLSRLLKQSWAPNARTTDYFGTLAPEVSAGFEKADVQVWKIAGGLLNKKERSQLDQRIEQWVKETPDIHSVSFARLSDIDSVFDAKLEADVARSQGLMDVLDEAVRSAEEFRMLGERSIWLAARAPILMRMTAEASIVSAFDVPQVQTALKATQDLPLAVDHLSERIHDAATTFEQQRKAMFADIESARGSFKPMLDEVKEVIVLADSAVREARKLSTERSEAAEAAANASRDLREALVTLNSMAQKYVPADGSGSAGFGHTATEIARSAEQFNSAMQTLQSLVRAEDAKNPLAEISRMADSKVAAAVDAGNAAIDRAFWRCIVLLTVAFGLGLAYRVITSRLPSR